MLTEVSIFLLQRVTDAVTICLVYGTLWFTAGSDAEPPHGKYYILVVIFTMASLLGEICSTVGLPPLLGMLVAGFITRNVVGLHVHTATSAFMRNFALTTILLRAGVGLDPGVLRRLSAVCFRLAFTPCLVETFAASITGYFILGLPFSWGLLLGFTLAAVSPAIVVKAMLTVQDKGLGTSKGIPTLVIAAASIDDVLAITGFGVMTGIVYASEEASLVLELLKGPFEAVAGVLTGTAIGVFLWYFPFVPPAEENIDNRKQERFILTFMFGMFIVFGSRLAHLTGIGPLGSLTLTFVGSLRWRLKKYDTSVDFGLKTVWIFVEPFLFGLIGAEVDIKLILAQWSTVLLSILALFIGIVTRCIAVVSILWGADLNLKEKLFVALAWIPKATVQAALGPIALDLAREHNDEVGIERGTLILNIAAISIFLTAPLGAMLIHFTSTKLLTKETEEQQLEPTKTRL